MDHHLLSEADDSYKGPRMNIIDLMNMFLRVKKELNTINILLVQFGRGDDKLLKSTQFKPETRYAQESGAIEQASTQFIGLWTPGDFGYQYFPEEWGATLCLEKDLEGNQRVIRIGANILKNRYKQSNTLIYFEPNLSIQSFREI